MSTIWALRKNTVPQNLMFVQSSGLPIKIKPIWGSQFLSWGPNFGVLPPHISPEAVSQELRRLAARHLAKLPDADGLPQVAKKSPPSTSMLKGTTSNSNIDPQASHLLAQRQ